MLMGFEGSSLQSLISKNVVLVEKKGLGTLLACYPCRQKMFYCWWGWGVVKNSVVFFLVFLNELWTHKLSVIVCFHLREEGREKSYLGTVYLYLHK